MPFTAGEALARLKRKKAAGLDGLVAEHLQEAGCAIQIWLRNVLNAVVELEQVPHTLQSGIIIPLQEVSGKNCFL